MQYAELRHAQLLRSLILLSDKVQMRPNQWLMRSDRRRMRSDERRIKFGEEVDEARNCAEDEYSVMNSAATYVDEEQGSNGCWTRRIFDVSLSRNEVSFSIEAMFRVPCTLQVVGTSPRIHRRTGSSPSNLHMLDEGTGRTR